MRSQQIPRINPVLVRRAMSLAHRQKTPRKFVFEQIFRWYHKKWRVNQLRFDRFIESRDADILRKLIPERPTIQIPSERTQGPLTKEQIAAKKKYYKIYQKWLATYNKKHDRSPERLVEEQRLFLEKVELAALRKRMADAKKIAIEERRKRTKEARELSREIYVTNTGRERLFVNRRERKVRQMMGIVVNKEVTKRLRAFLGRSNLIDPEKLTAGDFEKIRNKLTRHLNQRGRLAFHDYFVMGMKIASISQKYGVKEEEVNAQLNQVRKILLFRRPLLH